ncbi:MAG: putative signal transduction protein [Comamonadaceae bacterium]|nr:MAG: putative signal transduction protein [Comamonadaceae bacterium]
MDLATLLQQRFVMPSVPRVMALLMSELGGSRQDLRRIDLLLGHDPALTTRLLQVANAPMFKLAGQIHSVAEALVLLRLGQVHSMVSQAVSQASFKSVPGLQLPKFWAYSQDTARVSRSLAGLLRLNQQAAYTCGLIHAVGELAMRLAMKEAVELDGMYAALDIRREWFEINTFGYGYTQVSAGLASLWHFPQVMVNAMQFAHAPFDNEVYEPLAGVLHLAIWRARAKQAGLNAKALVVSFPSSVAEVMGVDIDIVLQQDPIDWSKQMPGSNFMDFGV